MHVGLLDSVPTRGAHRRRIMDFIYSLGEQPNTLGDFTTKDSSLRERHIKIVGDYAITYWVDEPVQAVMIVDVRPADR